MMTENREIIGILNDWDHAQQTDIKRSRRAVRTVRLIYIS